MIFDTIIGPARPITWVFRFWPILLGSFAASLAATWLCKKIAIKFGIVDKPDNLVKTHKEPIAYLGGVGMMVGLTVGVFIGIGCLKDEPFFAPALQWLLGILAGGAIACFVGLVDDLFNIKPRQKIFGQMVAAATLVFAGIQPSLNAITNPLGFKIPVLPEYLLGIAFIIMSVLGATNSLNLLDGLDGLCAGVTGIITTAMLLVAIHLATWNFSPHGDSVVIVICIGLVGSVFGFLPFNRHPAKIFMGDAGSMLLGFMVAAVMVVFAEKVPRWWMASIIIFGLPILDTAVALARRLINHRPLFVSDRGHIYDQMIDRGMPLKKTVAVCYGLTAIYALIGVAMSQIRTRYAAIVYVFVFLISAWAVWKMGYLKMEGLRGAVHKKTD